MGSDSDMTIPTGAAAVLLGITPASVMNFARTGVLRHFRRHNRLQFNISDVLDLRAKRATRPRIGRPTVLESISKSLNPAVSTAGSAQGAPARAQGTGRRRGVSAPRRAPSPVSILQHARD